ncbi:MAG: hypothetical protein KKB31_02980 [Nanoarchaeota archaeon]|nr:hypothetical protein [Nanoarchaeota archaeon]
MVKKCIYCSVEVPDERVIDFCDKCGTGVWGDKMFKAIVQNMEDARERGDLRNSSSFTEHPGEIVGPERDFR